ncbi:hypothetical protein C8Q80DRAFT_1272947 [Daedaleopsis nitida]|nr:hypothetical protein C8Q80DRAFT_1272947 [Daedaleopsis nitida]
MYYNGYIIICIFLGAFLGAALFQSDTYYIADPKGGTRAATEEVLCSRSTTTVVDGNVWTSGDVAVAIYATFGWVAAVYGESVAREISNQIEYEWRNHPDWDVFGYVW